MKLLRDNIISKKDIIYPIILFLTAVIIFLNTTAPDVTTGDSGELLASAYSLGIGHPPGYPLYIILAKLFSYFAYLFYPLMLLSGRNIFDISDTFAFNVNFMSGFFSVCTSVLFYLLSLSIIKITSADSENSFVDRFKYEISFITALALPFINLIWSQSTNAQVYTINHFLLSLNLNHNYYS
jgi:uncharacterized MnhB-related membrane protein